jgi:hypothetical protein
MVAGHPKGGLIMLVLLKTFGTSFAVRLFVVGRHKLLSIPWFVPVYRGFVALKSLVYGLVVNHPAWRAVRDAVVGLIRRWRAGNGVGGLWRRLLAARRSLRRGAASRRMANSSL